MSRTNRKSKKARHGVTVGAAVAAATFAFWGSLGAYAGQSKNIAGAVQNGQSDGNNGGTPSLNNPAITISFSGQTALRNFDTSPGITELDPGAHGTTIILHDGTNGAPIVYQTPDPTAVSNIRVQLANSNFGSLDTNAGTPASPSTNGSQTHSAIRLEWHEQGSVDGFYDLINDQIGYAQNAGQTVGGNPVGPISNPSQRGPSISNPTWINQGSFTANGTSRGFVLNSGTYNLANTYDTTLYIPATGFNLQTGQNRVQFSVGEPAVEALAGSGGTPSALITSAGSTGYGGGYGLGNPVLARPTSAQISSGIGSLTSLGSKNTRQQFQSASILNQSTSIIDPQTSAAYAAGPWNTGTINNVTSTQVAVTAVTLSANPGTGLSRVNKNDAQWLQTTGRLQNGALFNVVARTVDTGQRVVLALNTGVDPSWAGGTNDDGNTTVTATNLSAGTLQDSIGSTLRFSGKTSGTLAEKTIASSRMSLGALSVPENRGATSNAPVRALDIDFNDLSDPTVGGVTDDSSARFSRANYDTMVSSDNNTRYQAVLISHYNTVKTPSLTALNNELNHESLPSVTSFNADGTGNTASGTLSSAQLQTAWGKVKSFDAATAMTDSTPASASVSGIKGDPTGDVAAFISNIVNSAGTAAAGGTFSTVNTPADGLFVGGFLIPGLLNYTRDVDGGPITPRTLSAASQAEQALVKTNYGSFFSTDTGFGANNETIGSGAHYGDGGLSYNGAVVGTGSLNGQISITSKDSSGNLDTTDGDVNPAGNVLFGNFNQNGVRDYSAVIEAVDAALSLHHVDGAKNSIFTADGGTLNSTVVHALSGLPGWDSHQNVTTHIGLTNTKGDLIVLGDFNGDGKFDGQDIYLLAKGASLADSRTSTTLTATATTFADAVRNPNAVLRKNAALDTINTELNNSGDSDQLFLRQTGRAVLTGASLSSGGQLISTNIDDSVNYTFDPNGVNAFNKFDVNRDGKVNRQDAQIVDYFVGKNYHSLTDTLGAVVRTDFNDGGTAFVDGGGTALDPTAAGNAAIPRRQISLVDVELNDTGDITSITTNLADKSDFELIREALGTQLLSGDANFDGKVDTTDFALLANDFGATAAKWSGGDFNFDGKVNALDFNAIAANYGQLPSGGAALGALVPEPTSTVTLLFGACGLALRTRRRRRRRRTLR